jgi:two-component system, NtrC family, sensor kinase
MKSFIKISSLLLLPVFVIAQHQQMQLDSLRRAVDLAANDTLKMDFTDNLAFAFTESNADSALYYYDKAAALADKLSLKIDEVSYLDMKGYILSTKQNYPASLAAFLIAKKIAEDPASEKNTWHLRKGATPNSDRLKWLGWIYNDMGPLYQFTGNQEKAFFGYQQAKSIAESVHDDDLLTYVCSSLADFYVRTDKLDSALFYEKKAEKLEFYDGGKYSADPYNALGRIYQKKGEFDKSKNAFEKAITINLKVNNLNYLGKSYLNLSDLFKTEKKLDSSIFYAQKAAETFKKVQRSDGLVSAYNMIYSAYGAQLKQDSAFFYLKLASVLQDSLNNVERKNLLAFQYVGFEEQQKIQQLESEKIQTQNRIRTYFMSGGIGVLLLLAVIFYRNNRQKQKAKLNIEKAYENLKATQQQLIQSEKMASLGELTAGIAHEIQNPLNFVNNFSEVNKELIVELKQEIKKGNIEEVNAIAGDIEANEEKINAHGKRADAIVKGMLQHSRKSEGAKEPTDINALAEEYLRLSYHGLRAKDNSFNVKMTTEFDHSIDKINIIPQDIGRVLLNLYNNAFYAVNEKAMVSANGYQPIVKVSTGKLTGKIEIRVEDNGVGVPQKIVDKIFQPFFTTKPTGQGTGLGLSLSYDIIKAHGGEIKVETSEADGTTFIIELPAN